MDLSFLNDDQKAVVENVNGPSMVLAGAGSGKTRTLVSRIQYLIQEKKVSAYKILALTFSNKAAKEMRSRLSEALNVPEGQLMVTTFHSFCARLLRSEATYIGLSRSFSIYDDGESKSLIKNILGAQGISQKDIIPSDLHYFIQALKNSGHYMEQAKESFDKELEELVSNPWIEYFNEYEKQMHRSNATDFGGLICSVIQLFQEFPKVLQVYQRRYEYVLVDEYQDTNRAQYKLVSLLSEHHKNLCVVGDEDQSIYSWRGADIRNILDFEKDYPEARIFKLEQNYRTSKNIIKAASAVIDFNQERKGKKMWTANEEGSDIEIVECSDDKVEAKYVVDRMSQLVNEHNVKPSDIALFYRNNYSARIFEDELRSFKIPYRIVAGIKFYERKEIKDILSYLKVVINEKDSLSLTRIINTPTRGIGARTIRKIEDEAISQNLSLYEVISEIVNNPKNYSHLSLSTKVKSSLSLLLELFHESQVMNDDKMAPSKIVEYILSYSGYSESLYAEKNVESLNRIENLEELVSSIKQFEKDHGSQGTLDNYLETVTLDTTANEDFDEDGENGNKRGSVSLMTVHGAKGLEYPYVFVVATEENVFPSYKSMDSGEKGIEEERRLFYVAMTRAMKELTISYALGRMLFGQIKFNGPSRFIDEIPKDLKHLKYHGKAEAYEDNYSQVSQYSDDSFDEFDQTPQYQKKSYNSAKIFTQPSTKKNKKTISSSSLTNSTYCKGNIVKHGLYGEGVVLSAEGTGQNEKILIKFKNGTKKKFMVKFAPIEQM
ncbi:UvrD-helicase domain-containing protein [Bacteriovoracaceae bacterium]|nr:UvrD-helicase domain-containing protein [Bacteriovoracaceae bacterium]